MNRIHRRLAPLILFVLGCGAAQAQSVVISQVYGGGGNSGATLKSDFIELHNNGTTTVSLAGWSVQYASSAGSSWSRTNLSGSIAPGGYYLVKQADGSGGTEALPTPDATGTIAMAGTAGKVALVSNQTTLSGACPLGGAVQDFVGFGPATTCSETAPTAPNLSNTTAAIRADGGCTDSNNNSADFSNGAPTPRNSASPAHACADPSIPVINIDDASVAEGDAGTATLTFTVSLSIPAPAGGVSFDIATSDGTATAGEDYVARALTGQVIAQGDDSYTFAVTVNGDTDPEADESLVVTLGNVVGANVGDVSGLGTILNDDFAALTIAQIQGSGTESPYKGIAVVTEGVVTALRSNAFFLQSTVDDGDPATSEGITVYTGGAPGVAVGDLVRVSGTVAEYVTSASQMPVTQINPSNVTAIGTAPLPAPVELTAAMVGPDSLPDVLENLEGMRVHVARGRIVAPTRGANNEFEFVVDGVPRPMREAGIGIFDPFVVPTALEDTIPYFDADQERIKAYPLVGSAPLVEARGTVENLTGVLTYYGHADAMASWELLYDAADPGLVIQSGTAQAVDDAGPDDVTVAGFNLEWFTSNADRVAKAAAAICDWLKAPDILATSEVDNLATLTALAARLNNTCGRAPVYAAHMLDTDPGNQQRLGFLVDTRAVSGAIERVEVLDIQQHNEGTLLKDQNGNPVPGEELNDRPPLRLKAVVHFSDGRSYPLTVIAVHQKSLIGVDSTASGRNGYPTEGARNRAKRAQQAVELAQLVDDLQTANPAERIVLVGDFNAFEVNDGYVDVMGITTGQPAPQDQVILWADSPLSVANGGRPLTVGNELIVDPEERYSYIYGNISQTLDHAVLNDALLHDPDVALIRVDHARINADFRDAYSSVFHAQYSAENPPLRVSDHDPVRVKITLGDAGDASLGWSSRSSGPQGMFTDLVFENLGPDPMQGAQVRIAVTMPAGASASVGAPSGWSCVREAGGAAFLCATAKTLQAGRRETFSVTVRPRRAFASGDSIRLTADASSGTVDPTSGNNHAELVLTLP